MCMVLSSAYVGDSDDEMVRWFCGSIKRNEGGKLVEEEGFEVEETKEVRKGAHEQRSGICG